MVWSNLIFIHLLLVLNKEFCINYVLDHIHHFHKSFNYSKNNFFKNNLLFIKQKVYCEADMYKKK